MFGLRNQHGSCWINAALQGILRIPDLQKKYSDKDLEITDNPVERALQEIWTTRGEEGLKDLYQCVKVSTKMPAGEDIGDSHELLDFIWDKVPFLDKLVRFPIVNVVQCKNCKHKETRKDTLTEFSLAPSSKEQLISECIAEASQPMEISDWKCEKCNEMGCTKQCLVESFPQVMVIHKTNIDNSIRYTPIFVLNKQKYALVSIVCYTGSHWFTYGRHLPPGKPWHLFDDSHVQSFSATYFPLASTMRLLIYYRLNE
jgi:ubiquitin C-terminal hydrolase